MNKRVCKADQIKLIMECRQSGLSDYQWCRKQGINPGTFYNWVSKLRKAGYTVPEPAGKVSGAPVMQEVVKLAMAEGGISMPAMPEQNTSLSALSGVPCVAAEIECRNIRVRIFNGADAAVVQNTLKCIGGMAHAW